MGLKQSEYWILHVDEFQYNISGFLADYFGKIDPGSEFGVKFPFSRLVSSFNLKECGSVDFFKELENEVWDFCRNPAA